MPDSFSGMLNSILQRKRSQMDRGADYGLPGDIALAIDGASTTFLPYWDQSSAYKRWLLFVSVPELEAMRLAIQTGTPPFDKIDRKKPEDIDGAIPILAYWLKENSVAIADGSIIGTLQAERRPVAEDGNGNTPRRKHTAKTFLAEILAEGPVAVLDIEEQARACGLLPAGRDASNHRPFRKAKRALNVKSIKGGTFAGGWSWAIETASDDLQRAPGADRGSGGTGEPHQVHAAHSDVG